MEQYIKTDEVKKNLQKGGFSSAHLDEFARVLSLRLNEEITPLGFLMAFELCISDMEKAQGREITWGGAPGAGIQSFIAGLPIGGVCRMVLPTMVKKVFPEDFAAAIMAERDDIFAELSALSK